MDELFIVYTCENCGEQHHKNVYHHEIKEMKYCCYCGSDRLTRKEYNYFDYEWEFIKKPALKEQDHFHTINA